VAGGDDWTPEETAGPQRERAQVEPTRTLGRSLPTLSGELDFDFEGERIGRYRIEDLLGRGGMGVVLRAHDPELDRELAIKLLHERVGPGERARARALLLREARAIAKLSHPNVIQVYDVGVHRERVYVAMELVRGQPLHRWMRGPRSLAELLDVFIQAARGLMAAHRVGLVHRDFKPPNVLVGDDGRTRVLDFGLARPPESEIGPVTREPSSSDLSLTLAGSLVGTPPYMAPEQFEDAVPDARADQFAFCVSLFEGLFGRRPFEGEDMAALRDAIQNRALVIPSPALVLPEGLIALLERGLAKHPDGRFEHMLALLDALEPIAAGLVESIMIPLETASGERADSRSATSSPRLSGYLGTLPRGLDSHPECRMHGGALRLALGRYPLPLDIAHHVELERSLDVLARADPEDPWLPEAASRTLLAAIYDLHIRERAAWDEFWFATARSRFTRLFLGFTSGHRGASLAGTIARLWNDFHRGTRLEVELHDDRVHLHLTHPLGLLDDLAYAEAVQIAKASVLLGGTGRLELIDVEQRAGHFEAELVFSAACC
jgi:serine/threonine protein kinase